MVVLIAAAVPVRVSGSFPLVNSFSVLDILLIAVGVTLFLDFAYRPLDVGYRELFWLLCVPLVVTVLSLVWSVDRPATLRSVLVYTEGLIAYLFVMRELEGLQPDRIITYIKRYSYLLIIPAVLLLLNVPGFAPQVPGIKHSSGGYLTYYTRLSHPFIGGSNNLATVLAFFVPILIYWGHTHRQRRITLAGFVALLAVFVTLSRGVLLAFLIAGVLYALIAPSRRRTGSGSLVGKIAAALALGVAAIALFYSVNPATREFISGRLTLENVTERSDLVSLGVTRIASRPILGYGADFAPNVTLGRDLLFKLDLHNAYLQQALYFGLPLGLLVSLALCGTVGVFLARSRSVALAGVIAYTLMVQLVSFLFESSFEGKVLRILFYMSIGLAAALLRSVERSSPPASAPV
jgi:O-antigen ligase